MKFTCEMSEGGATYLRAKIYSERARRYPHTACAVDRVLGRVDINEAAG